MRVADLKVRRKHLAERTRRIGRHADNSVTRESGCVIFEVRVDRDEPCRSGTCRFSALVDGMDRFAASVLFVEAEEDARSRV